ncbi:MAG: serine/threonine-protein kinase [Acidobacteriota bacterium]
MSGAPGGATELEFEKRVLELVELALDLPANARRDFLQREAGDDSILLQRVEDLLLGDTRGEFLERGALHGQQLAETALTRADDLPDMIGPFKVLGLLGEGGMGRVYLAEQAKPVARQVALKVMSASLIGRDMRIRFEAEREVLARLSHPNIAQIYEAGVTEDGYPFYAMELIEGERITKYCDKARLTIEQRLELFINVCRAVHHAHQKQILHRDIKPSNILVAEVDGNPIVKIIDFGIAKTLDDTTTGDTSLTGSQLIGTPLYMSPEAAAGSEDLDTRTDVYSLGVLLYELMTGVRPFDIGNANVAEVIQRVAAETPPRASTRIKELSDTQTVTAEHRQLNYETLQRRLRGDLDWILDTAIATNRENRYGSATALADDVRRHLDHEPISVRLPNLPYQLAKFARRYRLSVAAATLVVLSLVGGIIGTTRGLVRARAAESLAQAEAVRANHEAQTAERARDETEEVVELLVDLFRAPDATNTSSRSRRPARELTAFEVLERGRQRLSEEELNEQPLVRARLKAVLGKVYGNLGLFEQADSLLSEALAESEAHLEPRSRELAEFLEELGQLALKRGQIERAEELLRRAVFILLNGGDNPELADAYGILGRIRRTQGDFAQAEDLLGKAMEIRQRLLGTDHPDYAVSLNNLGNLAFSQGHFEKAEDFFRRALTVLRKTLDANHPRSVMMLSNVAATVASQDRHADALPLAQEALELRRQVLGQEHPDVADSLNNVGVLSMDLERYEDAERYHREALEIRRKLLGPGHSRTGWSLHNLAVAIGHLGRFAEAEKLHREAMALREKALGGAHPDVGRSMESLGTLLWENGQQAAGEALIRRSLDLFAAALPADSDTLRNTRENFAELLQAAGRGEEAQRVLEGR